MKVYHSRLVTTLAAAFVALFLFAQYAEARRGGGGGHRMSRGGPAASGSFNRSAARPQRSRSSSQNRAGTTRNYGAGSAGSRDLSKAAGNRSTGNNEQRQSDRQDRNDQRQSDRDDRYDQRQDNIQDRQDLAKEVHDDRQDFAKEVHNDRKEWYEDRWRGGSYMSVYAWGNTGCAANPVLIGADRYYECRGVRYRRVYRGGDVVYVVVN